MPWGTVTVGGIVFRETYTLTDDGGTVKITGQESHQPQTKADVRAKHRNVLGLLGATVPAVWTTRASSTASSSSPTPRASSPTSRRARCWSATWSMTLAGSAGADVEFESRVPTIARSTELAGQTPSFWHAPPPDTRDYYTGATVPSATVTRESAEGS
jgi:hypothetical protein